MRTNIEIDDALLKQASELTGIRQKRALVEEALNVLIRFKQRKKLAMLRGKIKFRKGYDHKAMRD